MMKLTEKQHDNIINKVLYTLDKSDDVKGQLVTVGYTYDEHLRFEIESERFDDCEVLKYTIYILIDDKVKDSVVVEKGSANDDYVEAVDYLLRMHFDYVK